MYQVGRGLLRRLYTRHVRRLRLVIVQAVSRGLLVVGDQRSELCCVCARPASVKQGQVVLYVV